ncbi:hypothetical protein B1207_11600 [Legionella quinlivanii]|uniref:FRG domain-containing protein n=1 Tax=Legionella quinlivanii TaxID=45073 RepID=A0A364LHF7_9GAMM|nr:FRG domain-containing protein [Legionella quinlivanii]RAP35725.1 hypothetical protein B1207_11600 [Legionella quinlivanii]
MSERKIFIGIEEVPIWDPTKTEEQMVILKDSFGNLINALRLGSWEDYFHFINAYFKKNTMDFIFREYKNSEWRLESSLSRMNVDSLLRQEVVDIQLSNFTQMMKCGIDNKIQLWAIGQHYGLWTPFLDWSHSPEIALYCSGLICPDTFIG